MKCFSRNDVFTAWSGNGLSGKEQDSLNADEFLFVTH